MSGETSLRIDVWSDVVCPWCYLGKRRLERALGQFDHPGEVEVVWRSFQLEPSFPRTERVPVREYLARKFGTTVGQARQMTERVRMLAEQEGLELRADRAWMVNTLNAHRLILLAGQVGRRGEMVERLMRAHHTEGELVDDPQVLARLGAEVGVPATQTAQVLAGDGDLPEVQEELRQAAELGVTAVPFFVLAGRYAVSGAQSVETFRSALSTAFGPSTTPTMG